MASDKHKSTVSTKSKSKKTLARQAIKSSTSSKVVAKHPVKKPAKESTKKPSYTKKQAAIMVTGFLLVVLLSFVAANIVVNLVAVVLFALKLPILEGVSEAVLQFVVAFLVYLVALVFTVLSSKYVMKQATSWREFGLEQRLPRWRDIGWAPLAFIIYIVLSNIFLQVVMALFPGLIDPDQKQAVGFENMTTQYELVAAYLTLTVLAPIAEELLFRGFLFSKLRKYLNAILTIFLSSVLFAILHVLGITEDGQVQLQWAAVGDVFVLAIILGILREKTGSVWAGILLHAIKNTVAFFLLFIYPYLNLMS